MIRKLQGKIIKIVDASTVKVRVERKQRHPIYNKIVTKHKNYLAHKSVDLEVKLGAETEISETKPISKTITWKLAD